MDQQRRLGATHPQKGGEALFGIFVAPHGGECELRRDRTFSNSPHLFRVYLDNFDELKKVDCKLAEMIAGKPSEAVSALREAYSREGLPRHPRKSTQQELCAEVQGAWVDGRRGVVSAKPAKVARYAWQLSCWKGDQPPNGSCRWWEEAWSTCVCSGAHSCAVLTSCGRPL